MHEVGRYRRVKRLPLGALPRIFQGWYSGRDQGA